MSSETQRTTLDNFVGDEEVVEEDGTAWSPETNHHNGCQNCGAHVDPGLRRVIGDNDGRVQRCPECPAVECNQDFLMGASDAEPADTRLSGGSLR